MSDESKPRRPRRRRRRGRGEGGEGGTAPARGGERGGGKEGEPGSGKRGDERGGGDRGTRRRRGASGRAPQSDTRDKSDKSDAPSPRRRRRRRGPRDEANGPGGDNRRPPGRDGERRDIDDLPRSSATTAAATATEIDDGWDVASPARSALSNSADAPVDEAQPWGDDADAPTPDVVLAPVLPADPPADDPDPATAYLDDDTPPVADEADPGEQNEDQALPPNRRLDALADIASGRVRDVVGVKFSAAGRIFEYDANGAHLQAGDDVVVETDRGTRVGTVAVASVRRPHASGKLKKVVRPATAQDRLILDSNRDRAAAALDMAREAARKKRVNAKIFRAELSFGGTKLVVYYSSEDRVDLRDVQNQLARELDCRVELRQVGVRDAAKLIGGIGSCGRELCCSTFLPSFAPVSIKMAKDQNMVLNPTKVSGQCGRLKCCLVYEQETYATMRKGLPKMGKRVITDDGEGRVVEVDVLRQRIRVSFGAGEFRVYPADQVKRKFPPQQQQEQQPPAESAESGEPS